MSEAPSLAIKLYGTDQPVEPMRTLRAGPLTAELDGGALRFIRIHGVEAIRFLAFVVRDKDWGTYNPAVENLRVDTSDGGFRVSYDAVCRDASQEFRFHAAITAGPEGNLRFEGQGTAVTDFVTNRTGFVVLHPVVGVSGFPVELERVDGSIEQTEFPELVDPVQPFQELRAITHEVAPGVSVTCRMEGDTFETEDHRQWNDASYKTYVRPIALPWPYTIKAGESVQQEVSLTISGAPEAKARGGQADVIRLDLGDDTGTMPRIGIGVEPQHTAAAIAKADLICSLGAQHLVCWLDLRARHGARELGQYRALGEAIDAPLALEAVIPCHDFRAEIGQIAQAARDAGARFESVVISPSEYLRSIMPGSKWPEVPPLEDVYDVVREAFPGARVGGGMIAFFPELNRKRPPAGYIDFITHTSNVITHACDDITVTENLEALPYIIKTCRSFSGGKPYHVGPSSIGMRFNPYGSKTMDNPDNLRIAMARMDPRQRGLINAAWTLSYIAYMARGGLESVAVHAPVGEFGLVYHPMGWRQPWFDVADARVYPAFHVVAGLAPRPEQPLIEVGSSNRHDVDGLAWQTGGRISLWVANLTPGVRQVEIPALTGKTVSLCILDADSFETCVASPDSFAATARDLTLGQLTLGPYAVVQLESR